MTNEAAGAGGVDRSHGRSFAQRLAFAGMHAAGVVVCWWLEGLDGVSTAGAWFGWDWAVHTPARAQLLVAVTALYFARHCITLFYLLQRKVTWSEALGLGLFIVPLEVGYCLLGCGLVDQHALGAVDYAAIVLVLAGSCFNTGSELQRKLWKAHPDHKGRCYSGGLFRYSMHINYFGDVLLFSGWSILTATWWTFPLPVLMTSLFIFVHIPPLDAYLAERYGEEFARYAARTKKLVPYLY